MASAEREPITRVWRRSRPPYPFPCKNSSDLYQFQERPLATVGWTCPPQSCPPRGDATGPVLYRTTHSLRRSWMLVCRAAFYAHFIGAITAGRCAPNDALAAAIGFTHRTMTACCPVITAAERLRVTVNKDDIVSIIAVVIVMRWPPRTKPVIIVIIIVYCGQAGRLAVLIADSISGSSSTF